MDSHHLFKCRGTFVGHAVRHSLITQLIWSWLSAITNLSSLISHVQGPVWALCVSGDMLFSASSDNTIKVHCIHVYVCIASCFELCTSTSPTVTLLFELFLSWLSWLYCTLPFGDVPVSELTLLFHSQKAYKIVNILKKLPQDFFSFVLQDSPVQLAQFHTFVYHVMYLSISCTVDIHTVIPL